ncbi:ABC transporter permease [Shumkonia mesophila]|uniref:ABC transporter permease n=1 Tax=Shumkonia mesophila TaxID=2838854 RepID=UPI0029350F0E|nr:iron ABC transporter permease [Shumkonia mesophila]
MTLFFRPTEPGSSTSPARSVNWGYAAGGIATIWLVLLIAMPVGVIIITSFYNEGFTLANYRDFASSASLLRATANSLTVSMGIALLSLLIGGTLAFGVARTQMRFKTLVRTAMIIALISPEFLLAMGYILLAGPNAGYFNVALRAFFSLPQTSGPLNVFTLFGLILTALPNGVAYVFLTMAPAFSNMDPALEEAARMKGATAFGAVRDITVPLMRPAMLSGALLAFATSLAMFGPPQMLGINVLTVAIRNALINLDFSLAAVAAIVLVGLSVVALLIQRLSVRHGERYRTLGGKSFRARTIDVGAGTHALSALGLFYALMALVVPYGGMLTASLMKSIGNGFTAGNWTVENYVVIFTDHAIFRAVMLSFSLAAASATIVVLTGIVVAYVVLRTRLPGRSILDYLSVMPLAIPGTALAFALVVAYLNWPLNLLGFYGTPAILLVAYLARYVPIGVRNCQSSLLQIAAELEEASRVFSAGEFKTVWNITIPLILPSIIYTWILVFILAVPELSSSIVLRGFGTQTVSTALLGIWSGNGGLAVASAFGISLFILVGSLFGAAAIILKRSGKLKGLQLG